MVVRKLISKKGDKRFVQDASVFSSPSKLKALSSDLAWKIVQAIKDEPLYPLQIAKKLGVHEQKIYYHINNLVKSRIIKVVREEKIKGSTAKYYSPVSPVFALDLECGMRPLSDTRMAYPEVRDFFKEFDSKGFDGLIVVGSPESHGPLKSWAKDGHYSNYISFFLGNFIRFPSQNFVALDTEVNFKKDYKRNFILIGGPGVNVITLLFNEHLPVKFDTNFVGEAPTASFGRGFVSRKTGKLYSNEDVGVIEKIRNPFDKTKSVVVIAGISKRGTMSAIYALTRETAKVLSDFDGSEEFSRIVKGYDMNGDGKINEVEVLE